MPPDNDARRLIHALFVENHLLQEALLVAYRPPFSVRARAALRDAKNETIDFLKVVTGLKKPSLSKRKRAARALPFPSPLLLERAGADVEHAAALFLQSAAHTDPASIETLPPNQMLYPRHGLVFAAALARQENRPDLAHLFLSFAQAHAAFASLQTSTGLDMAAGCLLAAEIARDHNAIPLARALEDKARAFSALPEPDAPTPPS